MRIQKAMAHLGLGSRRSCEKLVAEGRVTLDGSPVQIGQSVTQEEIQRLHLDGCLVGEMPTKRYLLLNKPRDHVTTVSDPQGRATVMDLLPPDSLRGSGRVYPVGRLDRDTTGVLLFTNDGHLAHQLLHPSSGVEKEYLAQVDRRVTKAQIAKLKQGPPLDDGPTSPPKLVEAERTSVRLVIKEGRKRQVRRMLLAVGLRCRELQRLRFGHLTCEGLPDGGVRALTESEVQALWKLCPDGETR